MLQLKESQNNKKEKRKEEQSERLLSRYGNITAGRSPTKNGLDLERFDESIAEIYINKLNEAKTNEKFFEKHTQFMHINAHITEIFYQ